MKRALLPFLLSLVASVAAANQDSPDDSVDLARLARTKAEWPEDIMLTEKVQWPVIVNGVQRGSTELPVGTRLKLLEVQGAQIKVGKGNVAASVPAKSTDLVSRVIETRRTKLEAAKRKEQDRIEAEERAKKEAEARTKLEAEAGKQVINLPALAKKARPSVMLLVISDASGKEIGSGTGFVVSSDGKLITNRHVVQAGQSAVAKTQSGQTYKVQGVLAEDPNYDLVLVKIDANNLPALSLESVQNVEAGFRIAVIGSPLGLEGSLTEGIVSAVRTLPGKKSAGKQKWIQITAAISPGSSGSPVLNANGEVIGVATLYLMGGQALNFAIPGDVAKALLEKSANTTVLKSFSQLAKVESDDFEPDDSKVPVVAVKFDYSYAVKKLAEDLYAAQLHSEQEGEMYVVFTGEGQSFIKNASNQRGMKYTVYGKGFKTEVRDPYGRLVNVPCYKLIGAKQKKETGGMVSYKW